MNSRLRELIRRGVPDVYLHDQMVLHGGKGKAGPAPDYVGAAKEQAASSEEIARQQTFANRPTQQTPFGSTEWTTRSVIDPSTGKPVTEWVQNQNVRSEFQDPLNTLAQQAAMDFRQPFDWSSVPGMAQAATPTTQSSNEALFSADRERYTNAAFDRMRPEHDFQDEALRTRLTNQGLTPGSAAYERDLQKLREAQAGERWNAVNQGGVEQQRMEDLLRARQGQAFGQESQSVASQNAIRAQGIADQMQRRGMSLEDMKRLTGGPAAAPFMGAQGGQAPNLLGAASAQGNFAQQQAAMDAQQNQANMGGLGSLASMALMMYFMSDERTKDDYGVVAHTDKGVPLHLYHYKGEDHSAPARIGPMAQEVEKIMPHLVREHKGVKMVRYGGL